MATRRNLCPNPSCKNNATGWGGNSTMARGTGFTGTPRSTGISYTGNGYSQTPTGVCVPGDIFTVSFYIKNRTGFTYSARTVYVSYTRSSGGDTFPETFTVTPGVDGNVARGSFTTAAAPANATGIYLIIDSLNGTLGNGFEISAVMYEKVGSLGDYFDGDSIFAVWDGADGNSTSTYTDPEAVKPGAFIPFL